MASAPSRASRVRSVARIGSRYQVRAQMARNLPGSSRFEMQRLDRARRLSGVRQSWWGAVAFVPGLAALRTGCAGCRAEDGGRDRVTTIDHAVELYISDDALQAQYVRTLDLGDFGPTEVRGGFFYNEDRDLIAVADLLAPVGDEVDVRELKWRRNENLWSISRSGGPGRVRHRLRRRSGVLLQQRSQQYP